MQARFGGLTPMGTMLEKKVVAPFVTGPVKSRSLRKPVLAIIITGTPPWGSVDMEAGVGRFACLRVPLGGVFTEGNRVAKYGENDERENVFVRLGD